MAPIKWKMASTACFIILINLTCLPIGTLTVPSTVEQSGTSEANDLATEVTLASSNLTVATNGTTSEEILVETTTTQASSTTENYVSTIKCKFPSEVHSNCSNSCPASCEEPSRKPCRDFCWNGCECAPGYVKNHRWQCIPVEECPKCNANEHYRNCGGNCEPSCDTYQNVPVYCSNRASCKRGCFCDYGFVRDLSKNGTCVPIAQCPQKCGPNEYWDVNGEPCIRSSANPRPACLFDSPQPSCVCNTGYRRNPATKKCEPISAIGASLETKCGANETHSHCGSECARNCFDENKRQMCPTICHRGCFCKEGYLRESSGRCVLPGDCRQSMIYPTSVWRV